MSTDGAAEAALRVPLPQRTVLQRVPSALLRFARRKPLGAIGGLVLMTLVAAALAAPMISTHDPARPGAIPLGTPSRAYPLGTDRLGRDIYSRILFGAQVSLVVGLGTVAVATILSSAIGITSGFYGGNFDVLVQRFIDMFSAFPFLVVLITVVRLFPPISEISFGPIHMSETWPSVIYMAGILGIVVSINSSRVLRSLALSIREEPYIEAARTIGASDLRIIVRHIFPNTLPTTIVLATGLFGSAIFIESAVSFVGVGLPPSVPSWGRQLNEATSSLRHSVNVSLWPGIAIALVVWGANMLGDALRDVLDPRLRDGS